MGNIERRAPRAAAITFISTLAAATAQTGTARAGTIEIAPEILVTGGAEALPTREVASSYTIITAQDIERFQYRTIVDALNAVPGMHVVQSGGRGTMASAFTRGGNSNQTLVLLNGQPVSDPSTPSGAFNFANIMLENVERIEVVRGPQSALYGSQAMSGVVNIITKTGAGKPSSTVSLEAGTLGTLNATATSGGSFGATGYFLSLSRQATDGNDITPARLRNGMPKEKDASENAAFSGRLNTKFSEYLSGSIFAQYSNSRADMDEGGTDAFYNPVYEDYANHIRTRALILSGDISGRFADGRWRPKLTLAYNRSESNAVDYLDALLPDYFEDINNNGERLSASFDNVLDLGENNRLAFGANAMREEFSATGIQDFGGGSILTPNSSASTHAFALSASDHQSWGERFFVTVSGRYDMPDDFDNQFTYTIAPGYFHPETDTRVTLSYGTGFKVPSLYQRFGYTISQSPFFLPSIYRGNPDLKAEKNRSWEAGIEQGLLDGMLRLGATYFDSKYENPIDTIYPNAPLNYDSTTVNGASFKSHGIEAFVEAAPAETVTLRADYTFTVVDAAQRAGSLTRRPRHQASLAAAWQVSEATSLAGNVQWTDPYLDVRRDAWGVVYLTPPSYTLVNVSLSHKLTETISLNARINNLFNRDYEPANGFAAPGIEALAGISVTF